MKKVFSGSETQEWIDSDRQIKLLAEEYEKLFKEHFYLKEDEIKNKIDEIFSRGDLEVAEKIFLVFDRLAEMEKDEEVSNNPRREHNRRLFANGAVKKVLDFYLEKNEEIKDSFFELLKEIKVGLNVDVNALVKFGVFRKATKQTYEKFLSVLIDNEYADAIGDEKFVLFDKEKDKDILKELVEDCSQLIYRVNSENIQKVINLISKFMWDEKKKVYVLSPRETFKRAKTLLIKNSKTIERNIKFLEATYINPANPEQSRTGLVSRVALTPSILSELNIENVSLFENKLIEIYSSLGLEDDKALQFAHKNSHDINNLIMISGISEKQMGDISKVKDVLLKYGFGKANTLVCMTSAKYIKTDPKILELVLLRTSIEKAENQTAIKKIIATTTVLNSSDQSEDFGMLPPGGEGLSRRKQEFNEKEVENVQIDETEFVAKFANLSETDKQKFGEIWGAIEERLKPKSRTSDSKNASKGKNNTETGNGESEKDETENELSIPDFSDCKSEYPYIEILNRIEKFFKHNFLGVEEYRNIINKISQIKANYIEFRKVCSTDFFDDFRTFAKSCQKLTENMNEFLNPNFITIVEVELLNEAIKGWTKTYQSFASSLKNFRADLRKINFEEKRLLDENIDSLAAPKEAMKFLHSLENSIAFKNFLDDIKRKVEIESIDSDFQFEDIVPANIFEDFQNEVFPEKNFAIFGALLPLQLVYFQNKYDKVAKSMSEFNTKLAVMMKKELDNSPRERLIKIQKLANTINLATNNLTKVSKELQKMKNEALAITPLIGNVSYNEKGTYLEGDKLYFFMPKTDVEEKLGKIGVSKYVAKPGKQIMTLDNKNEFCIVKNKKRND